MTTSTATSDAPRTTEDPLLVIGQAADYLSITKATLYTWRSRRPGFGPRAVKVGGCLRYRRSELDTWIADHTEQPEAAYAVYESARGHAPNPLAGVALTPGGRR